MSVSGALSASLSGLKLVQAQLDVLASNVSNVDTPGYTRKDLTQSATLAGNAAIGVREGTLNRQLNELLQQQIRTELGSAGLTDVLADYHGRLDGLFGVPGSASAFDTLVNNFSTSLVALGDNPASFTAQQAVLSDAQILAETLNSMSDSVQAMRTETEQGIANSVSNINSALQRLEDVDVRIRGLGGGRTVPADLLDQRDRAIDELAREIDIRVIDQDDGSISVFTNSGISLFDGSAATLRFDQAGTLGARSVYSPNPDERTVGTVTIGVGEGAIDLLAGNQIRSGNLAAYVDLRDEVLPQMQARLDEFASQMALSMSTRQEGSAALDPPVVGADGLQIDLAGIQPGNTVSLAVEDVGAGVTRNYSLVHVTDPSVLPLSNDATTDPNDIVIGVDLTNATAVSAALTASGVGVTAAAGAGGLVRFIDDGAIGNTNVSSLSASLSVTSLQSGDAQLPMFTDGILTTSLYTQSFDAGSQKVGFAGRITLNRSLLEQPSLLSEFSPTAASADTTRPDFLSNAFRNTAITIDPNTGFGSDSSPLVSTIDQFARDIVSLTGREALTAQRTQEGQELITNDLLARQSEQSGVNVDAEMARLTELQSIYTANAQVMSVAREMMEQLLAI